MLVRLFSKHPERLAPRRWPLRAGSCRLASGPVTEQGRRGVSRGEGCGSGDPSCPWKRRQVHPDGGKEAARPGAGRLRQGVGRLDTGLAGERRAGGIWDSGSGSCSPQGPGTDHRGRGQTFIPGGLGNGWCPSRAVCACAEVLGEGRGGHCGTRPLAGSEGAQAGAGAARSCPRPPRGVFRTH